MKNIFSIFFLALCIMFAYASNAQMSKKEQKEWKKKIKALKPEQYKTLLDQNKSLGSQVTSLKSELSEVDSKIAEKNSQISNYQDQISELRTQLSAAKSTPKPVASPTRKGGYIDDSKGVIFKVQIGAFKNKDLSKYLNTTENFTGDVGDDGLKRYYLGVFKDYWEADNFKKYLREMGVSEAWIVSFKDGKKVPIKDVLEGVI